MPRPKKIKHRNKENDHWKQVYLEALRKTGCAPEALQAAGISRDTVWRHKKKDAHFAQEERSILDAWEVMTGMKWQVRRSHVYYMRKNNAYGNDWPCHVCGDTVPASAPRVVCLGMCLVFCLECVDQWPDEYKRRRGLL